MLVLKLCVQISLQFFYLLTHENDKIHVLSFIVFKFYFSGDPPRFENVTWTEDVPTPVYSNQEDCNFAAGLTSVWNHKTMTHLVETVNSTCDARLSVFNVSRKQPGYYYYQIYNSDLQP